MLKDETEGVRRLRRTAAVIGETDEAQRCAEFLFQLDPKPEGSGESRLPG